MFKKEKGSEYPPDQVVLDHTPNGDYILKVEKPFGVIARHKDEETYDRWLKYLIRDQTGEIKERAQYIKGCVKEMRKKRRNNE